MILTKRLTTSDGREWEVWRWTGGSAPPADWYKHLALVELTLWFYCDQCEDYGSYWQTDVPDNIANIFWNRAKADAWSTFRGYCV